MNSGKTYTMNHWFDGFSRIHRFEIDSSDKVYYRSRTTCDGVIEKIRETGTGKDITFGQQDPCQSMFRKLMSTFHSALTTQSNSEGKVRPSDVNVGVTLSTNLAGLPPTTDNTIGYGGIRSLYAKTDANVLQALDPETLEPVGLAKQGVLHPSLNGQLSAAHGCHDHVNGDFFNYNLLLGAGKPTYRVFKVDGKTNETVILATIRDAPAAYVHSSFLTEKYIILCVWPAKLAHGGITVPFEKNIVGSLATWNNSDKATFYVIDRTTNGRGVVRKFTSKGFFAFHSVNAWDEGDDIVMDIPIFDNTDVLTKFYITNLMSTNSDAKKWVGKALPQLARFRLPNVTTRQDSPNIPSAILEYKKTNVNFELPVINPNYAMKPNRYIYAVVDRQKSTFLDGVIKYDTVNHEQTFWEDHGHTPGEPIFVADPNGKDEDDGVLLTVVLDGREEKSYLLILDAKSMKEIARAEMQTRVQFGFHGTYHGNL